MVKASSLKALVATLPAECHDNPTWIGLAYLGRDLLFLVAVTAALLATDNPFLLPLLWFAGGLAIGALFVIGHDAAHGGLFESRRLGFWVGQIALLPSLHAYDVWIHGHNRVHHGHTGCAGLDFVWHPITSEQYARLPRLAKLVHRVEWSSWGGGLYYLRVMWWQRVMNAVPPQRLRRAFRRDRRTVWTYVVLATAALLWAGWAHDGGVGGAVWTWLKVFVVPWLVWNHLMGTTVHIHHIGPDIAWHSRAAWSPFASQVDGTTSHAIPAWLNVFWHNIFLHVAHHVDPRIPFYRLPIATAALEHATDGAVTVRPLRLGDWLATTRRCKLYDFDRGVWTDYDGASAA
jgi:omega-6 fatty acid desaturase (delta-12 desaturase)